jgi:hypothetical protein
MTEPGAPRPAEAVEPAAEGGRIAIPLWQRLAPWVVTLACFVWLYTRLDAAAAREQLGLGDYLLRVFAGVSWGTWLAMMIPYSLVFFAIDSAVVWKVINWFNTKVGYADILPIRGSAYILSILNEQVGKGAMAVYLNRRDGVPGWEVGSSMLFIMFCEFYYLLAWAVVGVTLRWDTLPDVFHLIPWIAAAAAVFLAGWLAFFGGHIAAGSSLRERPILRAFRLAKLRHYLGVVVIRSPALLSAVVVYTWAMGLFGVDVGYVDMLAYVPVVFFGAATPGPMRSVAILLWVALFPDHAGEMTAFGFVMHNFFIFFNAAIGLLFLPRANRELFGTTP